MKHFGVVLTILALFFGFELSGQNSKPEKQKLTLRVTSSNEKPVSFVAAVFFKTENARLDNVLQETPYETTVESDYVNATFIRTSGEGNLVVELKKQKKVGDQTDLKASGAIVVVGTENASKGKYYQQTF